MATYVRDCTVYLGGTFNPPHNGHLQLLTQALAGVQAAQGLFVPCHITPHKSQPTVSAEHRLNMLKAIVQSPEIKHDMARSGMQLGIEDFELKHARPSYTLHTLKYLREKHGDAHSIVWVLGMDSLATLSSWRDWQSLTQWCNLAVLARPGWAMPNAGEVAEWWRAQEIMPAQLNQQPQGGCALLQGVEADLASSTLRQYFSSQQPVAGLIPMPVLQYIQQHLMYTN